MYYTYAGQGYDDVQVTLVDCPGHASLIRTIIGGMSAGVHGESSYSLCQEMSTDPHPSTTLKYLGVQCIICITTQYWMSLFHIAGAQIIDFMVLVVDVTKGIQTQTAEVNYYINMDCI